MAERQKVKRSAAGAIRGSDIEPYTALRWVGTLFKAGAVFLGVAIVGEFVAGLRFEGLAALPVLLGELARTIVLAVALWGGGDLVLLLVHIGHDVRAQRMLLARLTHRIPPLEDDRVAVAPDAALPPPGADLPIDPAGERTA